MLVVQLALYLGDCRLGIVQKLCNVLVGPGIQLYIVYAHWTYPAFSKNVCCMTQCVRVCVCVCVCARAHTCVFN